MNHAVLRTVVPWVVLATLPVATTAHAWSIGSQLDYTGCHEPITAQALRNARTTLDTAPLIVPTRDENALIDDVQFSPPSDFINDLAAMSLLLGVRDNDLKGQDPLSSLDLVQVHGNPLTQDEHCIRSAGDDDAAGNESALAACRAFIIQRATEALDGLDASGTVDPTIRMPLTVYLSFAGQRSPLLPVFYVKIGQAMHALEDGFTHTYRTSDGMHVTVVLNWVDYLTGSAPDEARDGPPHLMSMDHCTNKDPIIERNYMLATQAATELISIALDPMQTRDDKLAAYDTVTAKYLTFQPGCTFDNHWCNAPEPLVQDTAGCSAGGDAAPWMIVVIAAGLAVCLRRRGLALGVVAVALATSSAARAEDAPVAAPDPAQKAAADAAPAVPVEPVKVDDAVKAANGQEPGRDVKTPTVGEVAQVREAKRLGSPFGFAAMVGGSVDRAAMVGVIGARYRITESWVVGLDGEWNPWVTTAPLKMRDGAANVYGTLIRRFPMRFDRVNLRTSLHLGVSTLLFDVNGAPKYTFGPYAAISVLGLDYDLGNSVRIVLDPVEISLPVPQITAIPLYYEQFRFMIGIQIGA